VFAADHDDGVHAVHAPAQLLFPAGVRNFSPRPVLDGERGAGATLLREEGMQIGVVLRSRTREDAERRRHSLPVFEGFRMRARQAVTVEFLARRDARASVVGPALRAATAILAFAGGFLVARPLAVALQHGRLLGSHGTPRIGVEGCGWMRGRAPGDVARSAKSAAD
jgi:hypothetical protein